MYNIVAVSLLSIFCHVTPAIIEPGIESGVNNNTSSEESSSNNSTLLIVISIACSLLAIGIVSFLVVFLIIRQKRKTSKYSRSDMMPSKEVFSQHRYVSITNVYQNNMIVYLNIHHIKAFTIIVIVVSCDI